MLVSAGAASLAVGVAPRVDVPCPASIDNTGASDVTAALTAWLCSLPAGSRAVFPAGSYRVDGTIELTNRSGLLISGGSFFTDIATASRTRSFIDITGCTNVGLENVTFRGANANAGTSDAAYVASLEAQHFVNVAGASTGVFVRGCHASMIYGDFVYVGGGSSYVVATGNTFHNNGRQGASVCDGHHVWVVGNSFDQIRRSIFDLEPASASWSVDHVVIAGNTLGAHRLNFLSAGASVGPVDDVWIVGNTLSSSGQCTIGNPTNPTRKNRWVFNNNTAAGGYGSPQGYCVSFTNVDGVTAHGNSIALASGRNMTLFRATGCTGVDISGNEYPGGVAELVTA